MESSRYSCTVEVGLSVPSFEPIFNHLRGDSRGSIRLMNLPAVRDIEAVPAFNGTCQILCANDDGSVEIYSNNSSTNHNNPLCYRGY